MNHLYALKQLNQQNHIKAILPCFEVVPLLQFFFISEIIGVSIKVSLVQELADFMGYKASFLPTTYAGLPLSLGGVPKHCGTWLLKGWRINWLLGRPSIYLW